jgi:hypothetical protein
MSGPTPEYHLDDAGNVRVDFVWGNMAMQPDHGRSAAELYTAGNENVGWSGTTKYVSDILETGDYYQTLNNLVSRTPADSHIIAALGYSDFPSFIPNYAGDEDPGIEQVVPDLVRKTVAQADEMLTKLNFNLFMSYHNPEINGIVSTDKTVRVYAYDSNSWGDSALVGLRVGDKVWIDNSEYDFGSDPVTITALSDNDDSSWIEFETATAVGLDTPASGTIWPGSDLQDVITLQRFWNPAGSIKNENTNIHVRGLGW